MGAGHGGVTWATLRGQEGGDGAGTRQGGRGWPSRAGAEEGRGPRGREALTPGWTRSRSQSG